MADLYTQTLAFTQAVLGAVAPDLDNTTDSVLYSLLQADASESVDVQNSLQNVQNASYASTATGSDLDNIAADAGLTRLPAVAASGQATFSAGAGGATVPAGARVWTAGTASAGPLYFDLQAQVVVPANGSASGLVVCETAGIVGNIVAGALAANDPVTGVTSVTNLAAFSGGVNAETDTALQARIVASHVVLASDPAIAAAALAVPGCAYAYVNDPHNGAGAVTVYAAQQDGTLPSTLQTSVQSAVNAALVATTTATVDPASVVYGVIALSIEPASGYDGVTVGANVVTAAVAFADTLGFGQTIQTGPMWAYVLSPTGGNVAGLNPGGDWYTTSAIPTVSSTQLFRFLAAPPQPVNGAATTTQMGYAITSGTGSLAAGTYYVQTAWTDGTHDSLPSTEYALVTTATGEVTFTAPSSFPSNITGLKLFISVAGSPGAEKLQTTLASTGATYTLSATPTTGGAAPALTSTYSQPTVTVVSI